MNKKTTIRDGWCPRCEDYTSHRSPVTQQRDAWQAWICWRCRYYFGKNHPFTPRPATAAARLCAAWFESLAADLNARQI